MSTSDTSKLSHRLLYKLFEMDERCKPDELKKKFYELAQRYHPDHPSGSTIKFVELKKAYDILNNPIDKSDYDNMSDQKHNEFDTSWKILYNENKEKVEKLNEYIRKNTGIFSPITNLYAKVMKSRYEGLILYEEQKQTSNKNNSNHIYFLLDVSESMYCWKHSNSEIKNLPKISSRMVVADGNTFERILYDSKYDHIINQALHVSKCISSISDMASYLKKIIRHSTNKTSANKMYVASFMTFARYCNVVMEFEDLDIFKKYIDTVNVSNYRKDSEFTHIYDALTLAINNVNEKGNISVTTFVLFTDGVDYKSNKRLSQVIELIEEMKHINVIIITLNLQGEQINDLKRIIKAAKFGKLLQIGDNFSECGFEKFNDINSAFAKTKDIIVSGNYIQHFDIRDRFNLY